MTTPLPDGDAAEQQAPADAGTVPELPSRVADDAAEGDAVEQALPVVPTGAGPAGSVPLEADPADAAEQSLEVLLDEDEGRS
jgi:hypothetical protein